MTEAVAAAPTTGLLPTASGDRLVYFVEQFARFGPLTAADMVQQIPGFTVSKISEDRGLGDATQNVLLNGQRLTGKNTDAQAVLARIAVGSVVRLEIVDGASLDIPGLNGQVLNVVTRAGRGQGSFAWRPQFRPNIPDHWTPVEVNWSDKIGDGEYTLAFTNQGMRGGAFGTENLLDATGATVSARDRQFLAWNDDSRLSASYSRIAVDESTFNLNAMLSHFRFKNRVIASYDTTLEGDVSEQRRNREVISRIELGSDYSTELGAGRVKFAGLWRDGEGPVRNAFLRDVTLGVDTGQRFVRQLREGERVVRAEYGWGSAANDWQLSAEAAFNFLEATTDFVVLDSAGSYQPVPLPGGAGRVEEQRGQVIGSWTRPLRPTLTLQASIGGEYSTLSQPGTGSPAREFWRPKGSVALAYKPSSRFDLNLRLQRRVGQLDFEDFLASVDVQNNNNNTSNFSLMPPQSWLLELEANRSLGSAGSVQWKIELESISDIVDQVPISATEEAVGNLPGAERLRASMRAGLLLDGLGITGGRIDSTAIYASERLRDPLQGTRRPVSFSEPWSWTLEFRHDVPRTPWVYGFQSDHAGREVSYRLDYESYVYRQRPQFVLFAEHKNVFGLKVRALLQNTLQRGERSVETFYVDRSDGPVSSYRRAQERIRVHLSAAGERNVLIQAATAVACVTGTRIRWSKAPSAAVDPAPSAMTICLKATVVQSPAANTPGTDVWPRVSISISPRFVSATLPLSQSVLARRRFFSWKTKRAYAPSHCSRLSRRATRSSPPRTERTRCDSSTSITGRWTCCSPTS